MTDIRVMIFMFLIFSGCKQNVKGMNMKYLPKRILIFIMLLCNCFAGAQQVITSVVCDKATKLPVSDVYIVLDGTYTYAVTDASGRFELKTKTTTKASMALYHISYHEVIIDHPFDALTDTLYIEERTNTISEVLVTARKKKTKIINRTVIVEFIKFNTDSISNLKLIRSSSYPTIDAYALHTTKIVASNKKLNMPIGKPLKNVSTIRFDKNCPTCWIPYPIRSFIRY